MNREQRRRQQRSGRSKTFDEAAFQRLKAADTSGKKAIGYAACPVHGPERLIYADGTYGPPVPHDEPQAPHA